jgi:dipeptidyl aminopeptidase B
VTSWRLYGKHIVPLSKYITRLLTRSLGMVDSIYTERYMNLPELNPGGYINASISNVTGFHNVEFLLVHGSADDNVHFANSAHLLDMFTLAKVRKFRFRMFTDR